MAGAPNGRPFFFGSGFGLRVGHVSLSSWEPQPLWFLKICFFFFALCLLCFLETLKEQKLSNAVSDVPLFMAAGVPRWLALRLDPRKI